VYDVVWLFILEDLASEDQGEGSIEASVRQFSSSVSYVAFGLKVSIIF